ncbi:hypothetical protein DSL72_009224 [Monilinia vaccinii-corymbosi]|uniref:DSC E3 ubiquitin ligase complex subunit A n=1 Tax=Monilinia vaccinii-corymbosi TaxID=61207 RepID=A0A8A3PQK0_9HELO|nr:hypothetical protein DSL72_009224 [Monilinia vaccinii-corymbosi]
MPQPRGNAPALLLIIMVLWWLGSDDTSLPSNFGDPQDYVKQQLAHNRYVFGVLNTTNYGDFAPQKLENASYLNLTGFKAEDGYRWERLDAFKERSDALRDWARGAVGRPEHNLQGAMGLEGRIYANVTGVVKGEWARYMGGLVGGKERRGGLNLSVIAPGVAWAVKDEELWARNVTGREGKVMLRLDEVGVEEMIVEGGNGGAAEDKISAKGEEEIQERAISDGIERIDTGIGANPTTGTYVREITASLTVQDESSNGDGYEMRMHGVHWPNEGGILLTTTSDKFFGAFALPHFTTDEHHFTSSAEVMRKTLGTRLQKLEESAKENPRNLLDPSSGNQIDGLPTPHCEYILFAQVQPLKFKGLEYQDRSPKAYNFVHELENELRFPAGAPIPQPPKLQLSTIIFSPDCGFMLESKGPPGFAPVDGEHLVGMKQEVWLQSIRSWLTILAVVALGQVLILKVQCKEASTPSTVGRVSVYTVAIMLLADGLLFFTMSLASATLSSIFPSALLPSFTGLMSVAVGVRFIANIYSVQEPERLEQERVQAAASAELQARNPPATVRSPPVITAAGADTLPLPVTSSAQTASQNVPIIVPSDQDIDAEIAENVNAAPILFRPARAQTTTTTQTESRVNSDIGPYYGQFILLLTVILFLSIFSTSWPVPLRTAYVHLLSFTYMSLWIPQIKRNITRNCRKALLWRFVITQSLLRLSPFAYFYLYEDNFLFSENDWTAMIALTGWVWCQLVVLYSQEILGPRWAIPKRFGWYKEGWDYHPILREDNVESGGLPIGLVKVPLNDPKTPGFEETDMDTSTERDRDRDSKPGIRTVDCAICMQILEVPVVGIGEDEGGKGGANLLPVARPWDRRSYMVTPCRHVFHSPCLVGWMKYRLQCPICREGLPPL